MKTAQEVYKYFIRFTNKVNIEESSSFNSGGRVLYDKFRQNAIQEIKECQQLVIQENGEEHWCNSFGFEDSRCLACQDKIRFWDIKEEELK